MIHTRYKLVPGYPHYRVGSDGTVWRRRFRGLNADDIAEINRLRRKGWTYKKIGKKFSRSRFKISSVCNCTGPFWLICKTSKDRDGYLYFRAYDLNGKPKKLMAHRLILTVFKGPPPPKHQCCHFPDLDTSNNRIENLRWGTSKENNNDKRIHGTLPIGEKHPLSKLTNRQVIKMRRMYEKGVKIKEISREFEVSLGVVKWVLFYGWKHIIWKNRPRTIISSSYLTPRQVIKIRRLYLQGVSVKALAKEFNRSLLLIYNIINFKRHVRIPWPNRPV